MCELGNIKKQGTYPNYVYIGRGAQRSNPDPKISIRPRFEQQQAQSRDHGSLTGSRDA